MIKEPSNEQIGLDITNLAKPLTRDVIKDAEGKPELTATVTNVTEDDQKSESKPKEPKADGFIPAVERAFTVGTVLAVIAGYLVYKGLNKK